MPSKPPSDSVVIATMHLAEQVVAVCPQPENSLTKLLITPIAGDRDATVEKALYSAFQKSAPKGWYEIFERSVVIKTLEKIHSTFGGPEYPIELAKFFGAELILTGQIDTFVPEGSSHRIRGTFRLFDTNGKEVTNIIFDNCQPKPRRFGEYSGYGLYFLGVLLFTLLYPIALMPVLKQIVRLESNSGNLTAMVGFGMIPVGIAMLLTESIPTSAFSIIAYLFFFTLSAGWVGFVMNKLAEKV